MSRKSSLDALFGGTSADRLSADNQAAALPKLSADNSLVPSPAQGQLRARSGAVRAMGATLDDLKARARSADSVENGSVVAEIETAQIDGSFVADRVSDATDPGMAGLIESMRASGQQVPILVRPHAEVPGRFQIAYGHRRVRAATELGIKIRAVIRPLTDNELVVAQGKENLDRRDLSFIERAFFALRLEMQAFPREIICAAMATDPPNVSRFITVARSVPEDIVAAIGPAPKAGRPRWMDLAEHVKLQGRGAIDQLIKDAAFQTMATDERFTSVLAAVSPKPVVKHKEAPKDWTDTEGRVVARVERADNKFVLTIDEKLEPAFGDHLMSRFAEILSEHRALKVEFDPDPK